MNDRLPLPIPLSAPKRKVGDVHARLKQQIMLSRVLPGQPLVELEIAATMGCSQGTVREAMLRLQEDGLIAVNGRDVQILKKETLYGLAHETLSQKIA